MKELQRLKESMTRRATKMKEIVEKVGLQVNLDVINKSSVQLRISTPTFDEDKVSKAVCEVWQMPDVEAAFSVTTHEGKILGIGALFDDSADKQVGFGR